MRILIGFMFTVIGVCHADTIQNYMNIVNNIPKMEIKADDQSQAWARSARNIILLTCESITESLVLANEDARGQGRPLFCLSAGTKLSPNTMDSLIQQTYKEISSQSSDKNTMTVSQVALLGLSKKYPCAQAANQPPSTNAIAHVEGGKTP